MSATITAEQVKALRERTNAAMMDCKKALTENDGDADKAVEWLRKKGITKSEGKAGREVKEGVIASYIHMQGKVGVLVEINCETDFVAKNDIFKDFVKDITLHIAAANPTYLNREQVPAQKLDSERDIAKAQIVGKPEAVIEKILVGKIEKYYIENCLLDQGFIKNPDISIATLIKTKISELGENIVIRRFARYQVGEAL